MDVQCIERTKRIWKAKSKEESFEEVTGETLVVLAVALAVGTQGSLVIDISLEDQIVL